MLTPCPPAWALLGLGLLSSAAHAQLGVVSGSPPNHGQNVGPTTPIVIRFDRALDPATVPPASATCRVTGSISGPRAGTFTLENGGTALRFTPSATWMAGEVVQLALTHAVAAADGSVLRPEGWVFRFRVATAPAPRTFELVQDHDLRGPAGLPVRIYGANTCDLDADGWADLPVICEDGNHVRVLMNRADGSARTTDPSTPPYPMLAGPSPNEACDIDDDGDVDLLVAHVIANAVSIAHGNGDGTFGTRTDLPVGLAPRGIAAFDVDADGDIDIVTANVLSNNLCLLRNLGGGAFALPVFFEAGGFGEEGLAAADMNEDGILDLVVGARDSHRVIVMRGVGDGTFVTVSSTPSGGYIWQLATGDLNGDGHVDVTTANSNSNNAAVLLGDGQGGLVQSQVVPTPAFVTATDLGDLDGDGDLDWLLSCHSGGVWRLLHNDGLGSFTFARDFPAPSNPACASLVDLDRDRDLDLVLLDEIADRVLILRSAAGPATVTCAGDGVESACPCGNSGAAGHGCANSATASGALLEATGVVLADTVQLTATGLPATTYGIFLGGDLLEPPVVFGDGLRCAAGEVLRFGRQSAVGGVMAFPGPTTNPLSFVSDALPGSGAVRVYQLYYRNSNAFCTPATFNCTNGLVVLW